jgi:fatty acid desaturase
MRSTIIALIVLLSAVGCINGVVMGTRLKRFLDQVKMLQSSHDIELLKAVAKEQMYAALVQIPVLAIPAILFGFGIVTGNLSGSDLLLIIVPMLAVLLVGLTFKPVEKAVQSLPAADEELARQRDEIVTTWMKKALPDW